MNIVRSFKADSTGPSFTLCQNNIICVRSANKLFIYDRNTLVLLRHVETIEFEFGVIFGLHNELVEISDEVYLYDLQTLKRTTIERLRSELQTYFSCDDEMFVVYGNKLYIYEISSNEFDFLLHIPYAFDRGIITRRGDVLIISELELNGLALEYSIKIDMVDESVLPVTLATHGICGDVVHYKTKYATIGSVSEISELSQEITADEERTQLQGHVTNCGGTVIDNMLYICDQNGWVYEIGGGFVDEERTQILIVKDKELARDIEYLENRSSREKALVRRVQELMYRLENCRRGFIGDIYPSLKQGDDVLKDEPGEDQDLLRALADHEAEIIKLKSELQLIRK